MIRATSWVEGIQIAKSSGDAWVLATVISTQGSAPRNAGSKIIVTKEQIFDTIGGGKLEYLVCQKARTLLEKNDDSAPQSIEHYPLSARTQQCCGGSVSVLFEYFAPASTQIALFGAGHVASALASILKDMPVSVTWIDNRQELVSNAFESTNNVTRVYAENPVNTVRSIKQNSIALVMTHDHQLDFDLCCALLDRQDCRFIGLIGSETKSLRFKKRLISASFSKQDLDLLHCPVGIPSVRGKLPIEIAISIAGQIVQLMNQEDTAPRKTGLSWKTMKESLHAGTSTVRESN